MAIASSMALAVVLLSACTSVEGHGARPVSAGKGPRVPVAHGAEALGSEAPGSGAPGSGAQGSGVALQEQQVLRFDDGLTWEATLEAALSRHPELLAAQAELDALAAETEAAGRRPNPTLNVQVEDIGNEASFTGPSGGQTTVILTHTLERGGKRAAREKYSEAKRQAAIAAFAVQTQGVLSEARSRFLSALSAQETLELQTRLQQQVDRFHDAVATRVEAGKASGVDQQQLALLAANARLERQAAEAHARTSRLVLAQLWDGPVEFGRLKAEWPAASAPPALADLMQRWDGSPGRVRLERELAISEAAVESAASERSQDWALSAGFRKREQTNDWTAVVGFDVPIPVFDAGRSTLEAARARRRRSVHQMEAALREARTALGDLHGRLAVSHSALTSLQGGALDEARSLYESVREGYEQGRFELLQVIEAQKSYFELLARHRGARSQHHHAWAELESLLGERSKEVTWN